MATKKDAATEEYFFFLRPFSTGVWYVVHHRFGSKCFNLIASLLGKISPVSGNVTNLG